MDSQRLYREIIDLDKQLREVVRSNPLDTDHANTLRTRLMHQTRLLVQNDALFAATHEMEQVLWKPCFYKRIEEFRPRIRKYVTAVHANPQDRSIREHFQRVSSAFQAFIQQSVVFYEEIRGLYWKWLENHRIHRIVGAPSLLSTRPTDAALQQETCRTSLHRCLVFLGDLMRYRELHGQKAKKNFTAAAQYYHQALAVLPSNGNPHNQLAVLAMYVEAEAVAVYRYCRSLLVAQPFSTAEENLALLFERSRQRPVMEGNMVKEDKTTWLKSVLHRFTRLHGVLFSLAMACRQETTLTGPVVYSIEMESLVLQEMSRLIQENIVGDALVLKLVITNIFCILQAQSVHAKAGKTSQLGVVEEHAIRLSTRFITILIENILHGLSSSLNGGEGSYGGVLKMMSPLSIYLDILRCQSYLIEHMGTRVDYVDGFLQHLVELLNDPRVQQVDTSEEETQRRFELKEYVELRGFSPLSVNQHPPSSWREDVLSLTTHGNHPNTLSEEQAWRLRVSNVVSFGTYLSQGPNPLLYCDQGQFATTPFVVSRMTAVALEAEDGGEEEDDDVNDDVDFDDEVIVYQPSLSPSPAKVPIQSPTRLSRSTKAMTPFTTSNGLFGGGGTSELSGGFGSFHGAFSNNSGLMTSGWGSNGQTQTLSSSTSTPLLPQRHQSTGTMRLLNEMEELTAVERESAMYQQKTSSLSGLFGGIGTSFGGSRPLYQTSPPPRPQRSVSSGNPRLSPPPGFSGQQQAPPGFGGSPSQPPHVQQPFFTRNPFVNP